MNEFTNREIATVIWGITFLLCSSLRKDIRISIGNVIKAALDKRILCITLAYYAYMTVIVVFAAKARFWQPSLAKDTVIWIVFAGFVMLINANDASKHRGYFKKNIRATITVGIVFFFLLNYASLSLLWELILLPFAALFGILAAFSNVDAKAEIPKVPVHAVLLLLNLFLLAYSIKTIVDSREVIDMKLTILSFALGIWLPLTVIPFLWALSLVATYEVAMIRMRLFNRDCELSVGQRLAFVLSHRFDSYCLGKINPTYARQFLTASRLSEKLSQASDFCKSLDDTLPPADSSVVENELASNPSTLC